MKRLKWFVGALAVTFIAGCAQGSQGEQEERLDTVNEALLGAPLDPGHRFSVGLCVGPLQPDGACPPTGTPDTSRCTATLVAPNLVLTARHCVERSDPPTTSDTCGATYNGTPINAAMQITTDATVFQPGASWYTVQSFQGPPGNTNCIDDIALLTLARNVTGVNPAGIDLRTNVTEAPPNELAIVGRGAIAVRYDPTTGERLEYDNGNFRRRKRENIPFVCAPKTERECSLVDYFQSSRTFDVRPGLLSYGPAAASGDSGSAVFSQTLFERGRYFAIGVNTLGALGADGYTSGNHAVRLDRHAAFIRSVARSAAARGGYPVPYWAL